MPPPELIDQAPVVADPPIPAPANVMAAGVADSQMTMGSPALTVASGFTVTLVHTGSLAHPTAEVATTQYGNVPVAEGVTFTVCVLPSDGFR